MTSAKRVKGPRASLQPGGSSRPPGTSPPLRPGEKKRLYQLYGKPLEETHKGEYIAIGRDGQTIVGSRSGEVLEKAIKAIGSRNFTIARVGHPTFFTWLSSR